MNRKPAATEPLADSLKDFFARHSVVDLYLPDGWYGGRPFDSYHELTLTFGRPARLFVELDERIMLTFTGESMSLREIRSTALDDRGTPAIEISGYRQLVIDTRLFGVDRAEASVYLTGPVLFVAGSQTEANGPA